MTLVVVSITSKRGDKTCLFADDTNLFSDKSIHKLEDETNRALVEWFVANRLTLNVGK